MRHESAYWSVEVAPDWTYTQHPECATFEPPTRDAAFQISAYRKTDGDITLQQLREFAGDIPLGEVSFAHFRGLRTRYSEDDTCWVKWWLRSGPSFLHATYNCLLAQRGRDDAVVDSMLQSLTPSYATQQA